MANRITLFASLSEFTKVFNSSICKASSIFVPTLVGINPANLSPSDKGRSKALVTSLTEAFAPIVPNVIICAI